jgi:N-acetylglucosamine-6-phosphate deacetylase
MYLSPGFIDLHVHGGGGRSAMEGTAEAVIAMADAHLSYGTTSLLPTTYSMPIADIARAAQGIADAMRPGQCEANILGIHFEGPCLSAAQAGAQSKGDLLVPSRADLSPLLDFLPHIRMMGIAPELPGALALAETLSAAGVVVSIAHSDATFVEVEEAVKRGFSDVTHIYSGCSTVVRRSAFRISGVVEAGLTMNELTVQAIADGCHLPPELLRLIYRCKGADSMYAITDGLEFAASRIEEGAVYRQKSGMDVLYEDGVMKLPDRSAFAGSVATMSRTVNVLTRAGIPLRDAVRMATDTPAMRAGAIGKGRVAAGYDADLILFDDEINVKLIMVAGNIRYGREYTTCA